MKKNLDFPLKNNVAGKKNVVISKRLKEKIPITDNICKLSCDQEKLYAQMFQGNPVRTKLLRKSKIDNNKLIKIIEDIFKSTKYPTKIIGNVRNKDINNGINIKLNGIKNLNESSKVKE